LKRELEAQFELEYQEYVNILDEIRSGIREKVTDFEKRKQFLEEVLNSDLFQKVISKEALNADELVNQLISKKEDWFFLKNGDIDRKDLS
jgi:siroheme synthase (precorrin-2 oxidase/ferrochelatase)